MPSYKENIPPTFNNFIIELLSLKLYKKTYQLVNNKVFIMSLRLNQFNTVFVTTPSIK